MKTVSLPSQLSLETQYGVEPILVLEVSWTDDSVSYYSDTVNVEADTRIVSVSEIGQTLNPLNNQIGSVEVTISDDKDEIKDLTKSFDLHKRPCKLIMTFAGRTIEDGFTVFTGVISSPFEFDETQRTVTFTLVQQIESFEVAFSPEEGQLDYVPNDLESSVWPLGFGEPKHAPAVKAVQAATCNLQDLFCIVDPTLLWKRAEVLTAINQALFLKFFWLNTITQIEQKNQFADTLLKEFLIYVEADDEANRVMEAARAQLNVKENVLKNNPGDRLDDLLFQLAEKFFEQKAREVDLIGQIKDEFNKKLQEFIYYTNLKKQAAQRYLDQHARVKQLISTYYQLDAEICKQKRCEKLILNVDGSVDFKQNTPIDVFINGLRFRVSFNDKVMTILSANINYATNISVLKWKNDDEPCGDLLENQGMNLIWTNATNLHGKWLLVRAKNGTRHIVQVESQDGQKVYFKLVPWQVQGGRNRSRKYTVDNLVKTIVDTPVVDIYSKKGARALIPKTYFTGDFDPTIWNRPETQEYLDTINQFETEPTVEEKTTIAKLIFYKKYDTLKEDIILIDELGPRDVYTVIGPDVVHIEAVSQSINPNWFNDYSFPFEEVPDKLDFSAAPGSTIRQAEDDCSTYVVNLLPSTIKSVMAYRTDDERRYLAPVPSRYYTKLENHNMGTYDVTALVFPVPISEMDEGWEDEIYVTYISSVGPNIVDILEYIIDTYTDQTYDPVSFAAVKEKFSTKFPANFHITDRPDALTLLNQIAREALCAIYSHNKVFYLKYLAERPESVRTLDSSQIVQSSFSLTTKPTEDLTTRYRGTWTPNYLPTQEPRRITVRQNQRKYGTLTKDTTVLIYDQENLVRRMLLFWLIREANTYNEASLEVAFPNIDLELFDPVVLDLNYFGDEQLSVVKRTSYNYETHSVNIVLDVPIRLGEDVEYEFYWPSSVPSGTEFVEDSNDPGSGVKGTFPCG